MPFFIHTTCPAFLEYALIVFNQIHYKKSKASTEAAVLRCSSKSFRIISRYVLESLFNKVASLQSTTLLKTKQQHRCFSANNFLRTYFSQNTSGHCFWIQPKLNLFGGHPSRIFILLAFPPKGNFPWGWPSSTKIFEWNNSKSFWKIPEEFNLHQFVCNLQLYWNEFPQGCFSRILAKWLRKDILQIISLWMIMPFLTIWKFSIWHYILWIEKCLLEISGC